MLDQETSTLLADNRKVLDKLGELYREVFEHDGFGEIRIEMKILRRGQKEVILHCGRQYRFVVDFLERDRPVRKLQTGELIETKTP